MPSFQKICRACNIFFVLAVVIGGPSSTAQETKEKSLYQRLGGYDGIAAVTDAFVPRLVGDPELGRFFAGHGTDSKMRIRQLVVDLMCQLTGGPCVYIGRPLKSVHAGLGISDSNWQAAMNHFSATLEKLKVGQKEQGELLAILASAKSDIVEAPGAEDKKK